LKLVQAYKDPTEFPKDAPRNKLVIDSAREVILVPIYGLLVPFHISTIKNASKMDESFLRINFNVPDSRILKPDDNSKNQIICVKEIVYRCPDERNLNNNLRMVKELRKRWSTRESTASGGGEVLQEKLILSKGRNPRLSDVFIRPSATGRKQVGVLEAHTNGFRFTSGERDPEDIVDRNIKDYFFQPAEKELLVLIHFKLNFAIPIGKKKIVDVQFCTEVMEVSQALEGRGKYDRDEIEDEQREKQNRARLNNEYQTFVRKIEEFVPGGMEFDIPYRDLGFFGVPFRSNVFLMPTVNCLVHLSEQPFFILTLSEVEIAYFERVQFSLRNFDIVFIHKDYSKPVTHINSISVEYLETIKEWLDSCNIKYYEGTQSLNWPRIMATIQADPKKFHTEDGGWKFLSAESDSEEEDESGESEGEFAPEDEEVAGSEDEEISEEDEEDDEEEDDDDEEGEYSDEGDEEGEDWDDLEERARRDDKDRAKTKRIRGEEFSDDSDDEPKKKKKK